MSSCAISVGSSSEESDVQIIESWDKILRATKSFKNAYSIFKGKKFNSPRVNEMKKLLSRFVGRDAEEFFHPNTNERRDFESLLALVDGVNKQRWSQDFLADKLAILVVLQKKAEQRKGRGGGRASARTSLRRAFAKLKEVYTPCWELFREEERRELNKVHRTPSLNRQLTGPRLQDNVVFDPLRRDKNNCPVCLCGSTMVVESDAAVNAANAAGRRAASANGGDGRFVARSAKHGCFCFANDCHGAPDGKGCWRCEELTAGGAVPGGDGTMCGFDCKICRTPNGDGCLCQVVFEEANRQKIATGIAKNKQQEKKKQRKEKLDSKKPREETPAHAYHDFILDW